ncbi:MAG TPA: ribbon-helix-helix protein, CopG family [Thermoanaerobaculia bacterium]|nr:ribbon-helix-helix protein, CopG family [Thermoanaerobaculia bacterium]
MRTTITIDDEVLEQLKARAAKEGTTVSRLIEESVRLAARPRRPSVPFELVTFGKGGRFTTLDVDHVSALIEQDDLARHGRRG